MTDYYNSCPLCGRKVNRDEQTDANEYGDRHAHTACIETDRARRTVSAATSAQPLTGTCTICGREDCKVRETFVQSTDRWGHSKEGPKSLGFSGFCPDCQCSFRVDEPQTAISV